MNKLERINKFLFCLFENSNNNKLKNKRTNYNQMFEAKRFELVNTYCLVVSVFEQLF